MTPSLSESSEHPFHGSVRKTDRAAIHLHALQKEIKSFTESESDAYRPVSEVDVESSRYRVRVAINRQLPDWWGLILGDFVQNLRAALDHLVCQLVYANGEEPTRRHAFPLEDKPPTGKARRRWKGMTEGLDPGALAFIEKAQPYHRTDGPRGHLFHALRELSNEDKHRLLLPAVAAVRTPDEPLTIDVTHSRDVGPIEKGQLYTGYAVKDGDVVLEAPIAITGPDPEVRTNENLELEIGFGRDPIVPAEALPRMFHSVHLIVHTAAAEIAGYSDEIVEAELADAERRGWLMRVDRFSS